MGRLFPLILVFLLASGCNKPVNFLSWERSYGKGEAKFVEVTSDSGLIACGRSEDQPYLLRLYRNKTIMLELKGDMAGEFTSSLYDTSGYITGGSTNGRLLLMRHSKTGNEIWRKTVESGFRVDQAQLLKTGSNRYLAIGSASPDTTYDTGGGLLFLTFDSTGQVLNELKYMSGFFVACHDAARDNSGSIYLALTRAEALKKSKATVAKFNNELQRIWEQELSNNRDYGAASLALIHVESGEIYIAGRSELPTEGGGALNNSFVASLTGAGSLNWKIYPESSNSGIGILLNPAGEVMLLNTNCYVVNILDPSSGSDGGRIRMFDVCDPYNTDAIAFGFDVGFNNDLILAGSKGGSFYIAIKPMQ